MRDVCSGCGWCVGSFWLMLAAWLAVATVAADPEPEPNRTWDVVIYGGSSAAVIAAIEAQSAGVTTILVSPNRHLGGLTSGGLGWTDSGNTVAIGGLAREFYRRVRRHYNQPAAWRWQEPGNFRTVKQGGGRDAETEQTMWVFEPHVAEQIFNDWLREAGVEVVVEALLDREAGVEMGVDDAGVRRIASISTLPTAKSPARTFRGRMFLDATYEGDLLAAAGVAYAVGREGSTEHDETYNGNQIGVLHHAHFWPMPVDPYRVPGDPASGLLPLVSAEPLGQRGAGDRCVQAYCFRMCLTDVVANRVPFSKPENYDPARYELLARTFAAGWRDVFKKFDRIPNGKTDTNNHGPFSTDFIGMNWDYPEASHARRREIVAEHLAYQQGLMWFLSHDERVPEEIRAEMGRWGLAADEFADTGHWPHQLYIREARRMVGERVMTEHEVLSQREVEQPVGMGSYALDSHNVRRLVLPAAEGRPAMVQNEGDIGLRAPRPYGIDYRCLVPRRAECGNLLVPVCLSATHIAFGSIRMEPVFMLLGQSAAAAAVLSIEGSLPVQEVEYAKLRERLLARGQILSLPQAARTGTRSGSRSKPQPTAVPDP